MIREISLHVVNESAGDSTAETTTYFDLIHSTQVTSKCNSNNLLGFPACVDIAVLYFRVIRSPMTLTNNVDFHW